MTTSTRIAQWWKRLTLLFLLIFSVSLCGQVSQYPEPILQTGETGQAWSMDFSPDGAVLAVANSHRVTIWDHEHKWLLRQLVGHTADVEAVAFNPKGKVLASGASNGEVAAWDFETGKLLKLRSANSSEIAALTYTADGKIVTAGWDLTVRVWDDGPCERSCIIMHTANSPQSMALSFDEQFIAIGDAANTVTVWRVDIPSRKAQLYKTLTLPDEGSPESSFIRGVDFDRSGHLAAVNFSGAVVLQDVRTWTTIFQQHTGLRLDAAVISIDGARVYVAGTSLNNGRILSFNAKDGSRATLYETPLYWSAVGGNAYRSIAMSHDGQWLVAGGTYLLQWNLNQDGLPEIFAFPTLIPSGTSFSPSTDAIVVPLFGVHIFSLLHSHFETLPRLGPNSPTVTLGQTTLSEDGRYIASPGLSHAFSKLFTENCSSVSPAQQPLCAQQLLQKPNAPPPMALLLFRGSDLNYIGEFEADEDQYPHFSDDGELVLWRTKSGIMTAETACMCNERRFDVPLPDEGYFDFAVDASANLVAMPKSGTNGRVVQLYSLATRTVRTLPLDNKVSVRTLAFNSAKSENMKALAIGTTSGETYVWHVSNNASEKLEGASPVTALAFSHDGSTLTIGHESGDITLMPLATKKASVVRNAHAGAVAGLRFGFGDRWIASLSTDAVQFWNSHDLSSVGTLIFPVRDGTLSWLFVGLHGLFEGESRAMGSILWCFSGRLTDVGPVELFARDYGCQGLMKSLLKDPPEIPRWCSPPDVVSRNRHLPQLTVVIDVKDRSQPIKDSQVAVSCLSWKWRKRSSVKIAERTYEEGTEAFHPRRKSSHPEAASCGQSARLGAV